MKINFYTNLMITNMRWFTIIKWLSFLGLFFSIIGLLGAEGIIPVLCLLGIIILHFLVIFGLGSMRWWGAISFFILYSIKCLNGIYNLIHYHDSHLTYFSVILSIYLIMLIPTYPYFKKRRLFFDPLPKNCPQSIIDDFLQTEEKNKSLYKSEFL